MKRINQIEPVISLKDQKEINKYLKSGGWITENKISKKFEVEFSKLVRAKYSIVYPNGTLTILSILLALGIKKMMKLSCLIIQWWQLPMLLSLQEESQSSVI